jgi:hypothetical protein
VPERLTVLVPPLVTKLNVPDWEPIAVGVKVTLTVQLAPTARLDAQFDAAAKGPVADTEVMLTAVLPEFDSWTLCAAEVVETFWLPNARLPTFVLSEV